MTGSGVSEMTLYVLTWGYDYESDVVAGVFTSEDEALRAAYKLNLRNSMHYDITRCVLGKVELPE